MKGCVDLIQDYDFSAFAPIREEKDEDFDAKSVPLWKPVELGRIYVYTDACYELVSREIYVTRHAQKLLSSIRFPHVRKTVNLAIISGREMGLTENRPHTFREFRERAESLGFTPPSAEAIIIARLTCKLEEGETLVSLSDPIPIEIDNWDNLGLVFVLRRWNGEEFLGTEDQECRLHPESKFIVEIPEAE